MQHHMTPTKGGSPTALSTTTPSPSRVHIIQVRLGFIRLHHAYLLHHSFLLFPAIVWLAMSWLRLMLIWLVTCHVFLFESFSVFGLMPLRVDILMAHNSIVLFDLDFCVFFCSALPLTFDVYLSVIKYILVKLCFQHESLLPLLCDGTFLFDNITFCDILS